MADYQEYRRRVLHRRWRRRFMAAGLLFLLVLLVPLTILMTTPGCRVRNAAIIRVTHS